jgi:phosphoribosyl 1,2-cyclic phosphodiesterase
MRLKFWGVRGSIPVPGPTTVKYGGNTSCLEVRGAGGEMIILDAGSGLRSLGLDILRRGKPFPRLNLFISHTHWDHIQGFPFFAPCYVPGLDIDVRGPIHFAETKTLQDIFDLQMQYDFFPVANEQLAAKINFQSIKETEFEVGKIQCGTQFTNHPILCLAYRLKENGRTLIYTADHEPYSNVFADKNSTDSGDDALFGNLDQTVNVANQRFLDFIKDTDVLVVDCQYTPEEYRTSRRGWGHSSWDYCLNWMKEAKVKRMILTHHDPERSDQALEALLANARAAAVELGLDPEKISVAQEGQEIDI